MRIVALSVVAFLHIAVFPARPVDAAPVPPRLVVNHETKQCAEIFGGDECMSCYPPEGWETLGNAGEVQCPTGYVQIEDLEVECRPFKSEFCCSEGHSGAHGDCEDLVVDHRRRLCAFVDDIHSTTLPAGWTQRPAGLSRERWYCPNDYEWVGSPDEVTEDSRRSGDTGLSCLGVVVMMPVVLTVFFVSRRHR